MAASTFDEFVRTENKRVNGSDAGPLFWQREKEEWLRHVEALHSIVREFLLEYTEAGQVLIDMDRVSLNEPHIGEYFAPRLLIGIGAKTVALEPIGTETIFTKGRVDVVGPFDRAQLLLLDSSVRNASEIVKVSHHGNGELRPAYSERVEWVWRLVTRPPNREIIPLTKDAFLSLLVKLANG
jgi:hypothetical protein